MAKASKTTTTAPMGLAGFAQAVPSKAKADTKEVVNADRDVAPMIDQYQDAKEQKERAEGLMKEAEAVVKEAGRKWAITNIFEKGKSFASFILSSPKTGLLYIVQDRFKMVTDDNVEAIRKVVGAHHLTETTKYTLNPEVLEKHQDKIAKAIQAMDIPVEDKGRLLLMTKSYVYDFELNDIPRIAQENKVSVDRVFEAVIPVQQLKTREA